MYNLPKKSITHKAYSYPPRDPIMIQRRGTHAKIAKSIMFVLNMISSIVLIPATVIVMSAGYVRQVYEEKQEAKSQA